MAECHPVGFQWVLEAKARGATIIHVDPRFTRTGALADLHVPLRAGTDIALLGALINYALQNDKYFRDYVVAYTNASVILREDFKDTEDLDGLFSGWDDEKGSYQTSTWQYEGVDMPSSAGKRQQAAKAEGAVGGSGQSEGAEGDSEDERQSQEGRDTNKSHEHGSHGASLENPQDIRRDPTLQHPRCVFQVLKRHYRRYTPEMVEQVCGVPRDVFLQFAETVTRNSGRDRTTAWAYAVGWTQHTVGVQMIRAASVLQTLLGNIGRPGGGILALRGHASIQGSTDIPTLYNLLPGYLPMPHANTPTFDSYIAEDAAETGYWGNMRAYAVSLLKAYWGAAAQPENDWCFDYLPRITGDHSTYKTVQAAARGHGQGVLPQRPEPGRGLRQRQGATPGDGQPRLARRAGLPAHRERDLVEGRPRDRDGGAANRGHRDRGVLPSRGGPHGEGRQLHQHPADAAVAPQGGGAAGRRPQ